MHYIVIRNSHSGRLFGRSLVGARVVIPLNLPCFPPLGISLLSSPFSLEWGSLTDLRLQWNLIGVHLINPFSVPVRDLHNPRKTGTSHAPAGDIRFWYRMRVPSIWTVAATAHIPHMPRHPVHLDDLVRQNAGYQAGF